MRDSFIIYRSFYEAVKELPPAIQSELFIAFCEYSLDFKEPELTGISKTVWTLVRPILEANNKRFMNGKVEKKKQTISKTEAKPKQNRSKAEGNKDKDKDKDKDVDKDKDKDKDLDKEINTAKTPLEAKFFEFVKFRKAKRQPILEESMQAFKNKLWKLSKQNEQTAIEILEQSIANGWTGIFELKEQNHNGNEKGLNSHVLDSLKERTRNYIIKRTGKDPMQ